ncbi:MAG: DCC1-like thiol-disulfide oxidoreductase family protein [Pseudomonadota bacterium]
MSLDPPDSVAPIESHQLILYDGVCALCSGFVRFVSRRDRDGRFRFIAMQSPLGQSILAQYDQPLRDWDSNLLVKQGRAYTKSDSVLEVCRDLPRPWSWLTGLAILPRGLRDWGYDRVARNRYRLFGRRDVCDLPPPESAWRYLS